MQNGFSRSVLSTRTATPRWNGRLLYDAGILAKRVQGLLHALPYEQTERRHVSDGPAFREDGLEDPDAEASASGESAAGVDDDCQRLSDDRDDGSLGGDGETKGTALERQQLDSGIPMAFGHEPDGDLLRSHGFRRRM